ncbi:MAG: 3-hydroxyacyl-ACP dehydratase FabZ [Desulfobulbaceae bacterium]|nr:3-hydroxyacyl-ACP dehydratase FabZ [Desulfobulbaceae bacterium]
MSDDNTGKELTVDIKGIIERLPHRYPFLLVDRVLEYEKLKTIRALKNVSMNEPFFQGHFPGEPIMPGVLILEGMAQAGGLLAYLSNPEIVGEKLIYFTGIDGARFRKMVKPGDQIIYEVEFVKQKGKICKMTGRAYVDSQLVTEAKLMAAFA